MEFCKAVWPIIGAYFVVSIQSFFMKGFLPMGVNSTILALIPKKDVAMEMKDYRPISCCNVLYKVIYKIIANRLKCILPRFIASNQSAFIKDRLLIENFLLASELVKDYHKEDKAPRCAMKIDISKGFGSVQWQFLMKTLEALGFQMMFIHWIWLCISSASFSVQVNGELAGYFGSKRGLRQGCSVSPNLFVICLNVLSKMLDKAATHQKVGYHPLCPNLSLTHLCFADYLMVFSDRSLCSMEGIIDVFTDFTKFSGLNISLEKTTVYLGGVSRRNRISVQTRFSFEVGSLPVRYLGLPLFTKKMTMGDCTPMIDKIKRRIRSWTARFLSFAGLLQLLTSVIASLVNFWTSAYKLPNRCIEKIESLCSAFLWSGPSLNTKRQKLHGGTSATQRQREVLV